MDSASSCDRLDSVLEKLRRRSHQNMHRKGYNLGPIIYELEYWRFLIAFLNQINRCSDAGKIVKNFRSLVMKIRDVSDDIADDLSVVSSSSCFYISIGTSSGFLDDLRKWERTIGLYKKQVGEVLGRMSSDSCVKFHPPLQRYSLWLNFFESVQEIVSYIGTRVDDRCGRREEIDAFGKRLDKLYGEVQGLKFDSASDPDIDKFFTQIALLAFRVAKQALYYWLNSDNDDNRKEEVKMAESARIVRGLLDLENEVDPTTPEFLELNLKFIRALSKIFALPFHAFCDQISSLRL